MALYVIIVAALSSVPLWARHLCILTAISQFHLRRWQSANLAIDAPISSEKHSPKKILPNNSKNVGELFAFWKYIFDNAIQVFESMKKKINQHQSIFGQTASFKSTHTLHRQKYTWIKQWWTLSSVLCFYLLDFQRLCHFAHRMHDSMRIHSYVGVTLLPTANENWNIPK